jgi:hypothetical protein
VNKLFLAVLASLVSLGLFAQDSTNVSQKQNRKNQKRERINNLMRMEEEGDLIFNKHSIFGIRLATDGYGISWEKGKYKTPYRTLLYAFELNEKHDPKEHKVSASTDLFNYSTLVPYKLNNLYELRASIGEERLIGGKGNKNGVAVTFLYTGGLSLALIKPYFLDMQKPSGATYRTTWDRYLQDTATNDVPTGASGFTVGWDDLSIKPGVNAKTAMRFDYGRLNQTITAIEVGLTGEFFTGKIPLVYKVPAKQFFFNAYVSILFGSRK